MDPDPQHWLEWFAFYVCAWRCQMTVFNSQGNWYQNIILLSDSDKKPEVFYDQLQYFQEVVTLQEKH